MRVETAGGTHTQAGNALGGQRTLGPFAIVAFAIGMLGFYLLSERPEPRGLDAQLSELSQLTVPPDATGITWSESVRTEWSVDVSLRFSTEMTWPEYVRWARMRLVPSFQINTVSSVAMTFRRSTAGDQQSLTIESVGDGSPLTVQVRFNGMAS